MKLKVDYSTQLAAEKGYNDALKVYVKDLASEWLKVEDLLHELGSKVRMALVEVEQLDRLGQSMAGHPHLFCAETETF